MGLLILFVLPSSIYYFLWVLSADPRNVFKPGKWWIILPLTLICLFPLLMYPAGVPSDDPVFNALLAFGTSIILTPLLFGNIDLPFLDSLKDKLLISLVRTFFAFVFGSAIVYFESELWFFTLCGISLASFFTRIAFYTSFDGGLKKFFGAVISFFIIVFFYSQAIEYSTITYENWTKTFSFFSN
ncbi:hypothetical protein A5320_19830 [Rheinheimera sp. SA_1]|nr:hypothetical protein A5320_19830 [Rheinheimera sp. SA_1]